MGGMQAWMWGEAHPGFMDALAPMASQPTAMAARNWMMRRMMIETIKADPDYADGNYTHQPHMMKYAVAFFGVGTIGGTLHYQAEAPTAAKADAVIDQRLAAGTKADANDFLYAWGSSQDYDPAPNLEKITASVLAINSADDERNPPETGVTAAALKRVKHGSIYLIPASKDTRGHGTTGSAKWYAKPLEELLAKAPQNAM
jgi:homoserine O-acetyltransferase